MSAVFVMALSMSAFADSALGDRGLGSKLLGWQKNDTGWWYATDYKGSAWYHDGWFWINANEND